MLKTIGLLVIIILVIGLIYVMVAPKSGGPSQPSTPTQIGQRTKTTNCQAQGGLQDHACTPGMTDPALTKDVLCSSTFSTKSVRNVPAQEKDQVYSEYGISSHQPGQYEVDHLISLELGGSNDIANLWPEAADPTPGFHQKDLVENYLHKQVCSGAMSLQDAQTAIANNWLQVYQSVPDIQNYGYTSGGSSGRHRRSQY